MQTFSTAKFNLRYFGTTFATQNATLRNLVCLDLGTFFTSACSVYKRKTKSEKLFVPKKNRACFSFTRNRNEHRKPPCSLIRPGFPLHRKNLDAKKNRHAKIFICCTATRKTYTHQHTEAAQHNHKQLVHDRSCCRSAVAKQQTRVFCSAGRL